MVVNQHDAHEAIKRLWNVIPLGSGADFNTVVTYLEQLEFSKQQGE